MKLLLIEDEKITRRSLTDILTREGFEVSAAEDGEQGMELFRAEKPEVVVTDLRLPKSSGIEVLQQVLAESPDCKVILITAHATVDTAVTSLKLGAYDYLTKPFSPEKLISILRNISLLRSALNENSELKQKIQLYENRSIVGNSQLMKRLLETINAIAHNDSTVLIEGESGTGKELVARALHRASLRREGPFVTVSCSSIPETLLESELFGHEKGAFTGALRRHAGYFERAHGGTLFLDDIDDVPLSVQVKLLRVIQERELTPVGGTLHIGIDVRIICATKVDLKRMVGDKTFRDDLYYRLNIIPLKIPPLRERKEDIPKLVEFFFRKHRAEDRIMLLNREIYAELMGYDWPGNVRELENIVERMIALSFSGQIDPAILDLKSHARAWVYAEEEMLEHESFEDYMTRKEKHLLRWAIERSQNNITEAAKLLKIPRTTLNSKLDRLFPGFRTL